ncbi:MACPF domain-containing protein isoform D [Glycine soja]|uniref:MACPF domain-containing protein isoform D n=1 Tax=Glycine soja TaxID=3848 RepID=A0A445KQU6_GLYSO|nr:MACPF domain-containing protein isoform D [Glycine soja]
MGIRVKYSTIKLTKGEPMEDLGRYRQLVGTLNYLIVTIPDITFAVNVVMKDNALNFMDIQTRSYYESEAQDIKFMCRRKGGNGKRSLSHSEWCQTVLSQPDVISMSFVPITSLLGGINGSGYLTHAMNLYLRYKPQIEELHQFLEFQLPRQWAPVFGELALGPERKPQNAASLQFSFMGPKLYVNTTPVDVGKKPVTGLRLYLEGKRSNCLAIHLQHLSSLPKTFQLQDEPIGNVSNDSSERKYYEKVQWKSFSHVCTAPVDSVDDNAVVTGAHFEVGDTGLKKVLFLRLHFYKVVGATRVKEPEWEGSPGLTQKSGIISTLISTTFSSPQKPPPPRPSDVNINSALYPGGPPVPTQSPKLLRFVDTTEMTRGPQDTPGYWVVSGARLFVEKAKISLKVKYSLLTVIPDEERVSF